MKKHTTPWRAFSTGTLDQLGSLSVSSYSPATSQVEDTNVAMNARRNPFGVAQALMQTWLASTGPGAVERLVSHSGSRKIGIGHRANIHRRNAST